MYNENYYYYFEYKCENYETWVELGINEMKTQWDKLWFSFEIHKINPTNDSNERERKKNKWYRNKEQGYDTRRSMSAIDWQKFHKVFIRFHRIIE